MTSLSARKAAVITAVAAGFLIVSTQVQLAQQPGQQPGSLRSSRNTPRLPAKSFDNPW